MNGLETLRVSASASRNACGMRNMHRLQKLNPGLAAASGAARFAVRRFFSVGTLRAVGM